MHNSTQNFASFDTKHVNIFSRFNPIMTTLIVNICLKPKPTDCTIKLENLNKALCLSNLLVVKKKAAEWKDRMKT